MATRRTSMHYPHAISREFFNLRLTLILFCVLYSIAAFSSEERIVRFQKQDGKILIHVGDEYFGSYVYRDAKILRPYFCDLHAPGGVQVTRNHPPREGDSTDHADMHPGLWMAFGDMNGYDFWRNKARVRHVRFSREPEDGDMGRFAVENEYLSNEGSPLCMERCRIDIRVVNSGYLIVWNSEFQAKQGDFYFGDQEEMGLGVRVATPLAVKNEGRILNGDGAVNEKEVWGKQADWCDYSGMLNGKWVGVALMASPNNFRRCWFHARDYGFVAANPFGRNAFTKEGKSKVVVKNGDVLRLEYGIYIHSSKTEKEIDLQSIYDRLYSKR